MAKPDQRGGRRATQVVDIRVRNTEVLSNGRDHFLLFLIERHAARDHVVEDFGNFRIELEIGSTCF